MITNLGELKAAVIDWSHRADLTVKVPTFVQLAESDINRRMNAQWNLANEADSASNWLLERAPDLYLWGALAQMATYTRDDTALNRWAALYMAALESAHQLDALEAGLLDEALEVEIGEGGSFNMVTG